MLLRHPHCVCFGQPCRVVQLVSRYVMRKQQITIENVQRRSLRESGWPSIANRELPADSSDFLQSGSAPFAAAAIARDRANVELSGSKPTVHARSSSGFPPSNAPGIPLHLPQPRLANPCDGSLETNPTRRWSQRASDATHFRETSTLRDGNSLRSSCPAIPHALPHPSKDQDQPEEKAMNL